MQIISEETDIELSPIKNWQGHDPKRLRILSYNIQTGLPTTRMREYITHGWRQILPSQTRMVNLGRIASLLHNYDLVALQEVDPGSLRSGFVNQVQYLAHLGGFSHWYLQLNRNLGKLAKYSNAVLSRFQPFVTSSHKLPGIIPGRGAIRLFYGESEQPLVIIIMHLALGPMARKQQMNYIAELIRGYKHVILMGDMNCRLERLAKSSLLREMQLRPVNYVYNTYPSWKPKRIIDHILVSPTVKVNHVEVLKLPYSDHLPVAIDVSLPQAIERGSN